MPLKAICPIAGCQTPLFDQKYLLCRDHWRMVPTGLQTTIWRLWHNGVPRPGHREACLSAIEQVNERVKPSALP